MENEKDDFFQETLQLLQNYVDDRLLLLKIQVAEKTSKMVSFMLSVLIITVLLFFILLFSSLMLGLYFSDVFGSYIYGFGLVTSFYLIILGVYVLFKKYFRPDFIMNFVIKLIFMPSKVEQDIDEDYDD